MVTPELAARIVADSRDRVAWVRARSRGITATDVAALTSERLLFAAAPAAVKELVSPGLRRNPAVYPPDEIVRRLEWLNDVGDAVRTYDRAWTELKMH